MRLAQEREGGTGRRRWVIERAVVTRSMVAEGLLAGEPALLASNMAKTEDQPAGQPGSVTGVTSVTSVTDSAPPADELLMDAVYGALQTGLVP